MPATLTNHAKFRALQRFGLGESRLQTFADNALVIGLKLNEIRNSSTRKHLIEQAQIRGRLGKEISDIRVVKHIAFVFAEDNVLVTVFPSNPQRTQAYKQRKANERRN